MATAKEEENTTRNAQVLYVIRFQSSSMEVLISETYFLSAARPAMSILRLK